MQKNKFRVPPQYLFLDTLGSVLIGFGLYGLMVGEELPGLAFLNLKRDAWEFIVGGLILMLPMVVHVIRRAGTRQDT